MGFTYFRTAKRADRQIIVSVYFRGYTMHLQCLTPWIFTYILSIYRQFYMPKSTSTVTKHKSSLNNNYRFDTSYFPSSLDKQSDESVPNQNVEISSLQKAKEIIGDDYTVEELKEVITSFEYLINNWMEEYEKKVFNSKTLKEILKSI